jgi:mannose-6-phosphate isomerase-like protein (cupin superfamily)
MLVFKLDELTERQAMLGQRWAEFLRVESLSAGIYTLPAGGEDLQRPHGEDEVYLVLRGRATVQVGAEERPVGPGDLIYVGARDEHRFFAIAEELVLLVFFAPAEGTSGT